MENHVLDNLKYSYLWNKYRPMVLKLMKDAADKPQQYKFQKHEFHDINPKEKGGHSFSMELSNGRPSKEVKTSMVAKSLFAVLDQSMTAVDLSQGAIYEFSMDKQYNLEITLKEAKEEVAEPEEVAAVAEEAQEK
ncbi:hypothetical protein SAMN04488029_0051 [Reichenbachiella faecimaris]|uniref:Uncharacterized protein n=1 Tax=Reichenbachiella faecimaris TaxID=692418 RepID=A0A1W2G4W6_REIFA|nr:hypothetical protein [Reichenbachiella faecimaris]SMD31715.1 hypothetical protein SAMN04488029_0051 [Reichenbachiella faecimaris]